ncbi:MAG: diaminopimelate epimerase [Pseudomonadota bacterium]
MNALPFYKMHGLGNDFVVIDARGGADPVGPALARALGDRRRGVGFDQLIVLRDSSDRSVAADIDFWNADGSLSDACGNGARCAAALLMAQNGETTLTLRSGAGLLPSARDAQGRVTVDMGAPKLDWREIPLRDASHTERIDVKLGPIDDPALWGPGAVNMGNPHCVFFVEDAELAPVERLGPMIEHHPMFPERTNVEFAQVLDRGRIRVRVWERGVGVTLACGSGACAVAVAAARRLMTERRVEILMDGGPLAVEWRESDGHVLLTGPTMMVFAGALTPDFLAAAGEAQG